MLSYRGAGYTPAFVKNFDEVIAKINGGATIEIVSGVDAVCGALRQGAQITCDHAKTCRSELTKRRDEKALMIVAKALRLPGLKTDNCFVLKDRGVRYLRQLFTHGALRRDVCIGCSWNELCTQIAKDKFSGVRLMPQAIPYVKKLRA
jgi:hypothetical protein